MKISKSMYYISSLINTFFVSGQKPVPAEYESEVMDMLKKHAANDDLEVRNTQPGLYD